jgi:tRNA pseudouridine38-40 synthase
MNKIALGVEYDGTHYYGWQRQTAQTTIQGCLETALSRIENAPISVVCAGRTDAGVHALSQVVHFYSKTNRTIDNWIRGGNTQLPDSITIHWAKPVDETFHARFSAVSRRYCYLIYNHPTRSSLMRSYITRWHQPLDEKRMQIAANYLLGEHDFSSFRAINCQAKTARRMLHHIDVKRDGDFIIIDVKANAFLHHMVRNIAGTLLKVGEGNATPEWVREVLLARDRKQCGITAPSTGLYLVDIEYPNQFGIPSNTSDISTRFWFF